MHIALQFRVFVAELALQLSIFMEKFEDVSNSFVVLLLAPFMVYVHSLSSLGGRWEERRRNVYSE